MGNFIFEYKTIILAICIFMKIYNFHKNMNILNPWQLEAEF